MRSRPRALRLFKMGLGRRKVRLEDASSWVFNRMVDAYAARPPYPVALVEAVATLASASGPRIADLGAGLGHLAIPLAARGFDVHAVEPAQGMLERLRELAVQRGLTLQGVHAAAEALPFEAASFDAVLIADAVHFLDAELTGREIGRVLRVGGVLALVTCELSPTPFMSAVIRVMEEAAPRRPREVSASLAQLATVAGVEIAATQVVSDETLVTPETLEGILRSISFIGPAMNAARFQAFRERIREIPGPPTWARSFTLHHGVRRA